MEQKKIIINNQVISVEVAKTTAQMAKGLAGRQNLSENEGMLFDYSDYQIRYFHMKGMNFPLDMIWIKDEIIIGMAENVPIFTNGEITKVQSNEPVNKVLEVNGNWAKSHQVKIGDKIELL